MSYRESIIKIIKSYQQEYGNMIDYMIKEDAKYFRFCETIYWCFDYDEKPAIVATCDMKSNVIKINANAFLIALKRDELKTIEYFILHEVRHVFQHLIIKDYLNNVEIPISKEIVLRWIEENKNYQKSCDENGNLNEKYFMQDSEMDAYAFSYAVMKYKYGDVSYLYIPEFFIGDSNFDSIVNEFVNTFTNEKL